MADRRNINFLEEANRKAALQAVQDRKMLLGAVGLLIVMVVGWLGIATYGWSVQAETTRITSEADALDAELLRLSEGQQQISYLTFINKTKAISDMIALRHDALELIVTIVDHLATDDIVISSIDYSMRERVITTRFSMTNVFEATELFERLEEPEFRGLFQSIDYGSLGRALNGVYSISLEFNI